MDGAEYLKRHERWRVSRAAMYGLVALAGLAFLASPSQLLIDQVPYLVAIYAWGACLVISALICFAGSLTDMWIGEYSGLPLLLACVGLYGLSALLTAGFDNLPLLAYGLLNMAFTAGLFARWQDVCDTKKASSVVGRVKE